MMPVIFSNKPLISQSPIWNGNESTDPSGELWDFFVLKICENAPETALIFTAAGCHTVSERRAQEVSIVLFQTFILVHFPFICPIRIK